MMEEYGKLRTRHYVIKTAGIFAKNAKILEIYDSAAVFINPNLVKSGGKDREVLPFKDSFEFTISDRNDKEVSFKTPKQSFTLTATDRASLLTDLLFYKV